MAWLKLKIDRRIKTNRAENVLVIQTGIGDEKFVNYREIESFLCNLVRTNLPWIPTMTKQEILNHMT